MSWYFCNRSNRTGRLQFRYAQLQNCDHHAESWLLIRLSRYCHHRIGLATPDSRPIYLPNTLQPYASNCHRLSTCILILITSHHLNVSFDEKFTPFRGNILLLPLTVQPFSYNLALYQIIRTLPLLEEKRKNVF